MSPDIAASVRARLLRRAKAGNERFELYLVRYAAERFLYRLGASRHADQCALKGAGLLSVWMDDPYRATRDIDLLATVASDEASVGRTVADICGVPCPEDGLVFDLGTLVLSPIRPEEKYPGQRAVLTARLGRARIRVQIDFGFGDAVSPRPERADLPSLLDGMPSPRILVYPRVASVAEKFEAMVILGRRNSRMKDFHDVRALSQKFDFEGAELCDAVAHCFARRGTNFETESPEVLGAAFYVAADAQIRWRAYRTAGAFREAPPDRFDVIGERVRAFLGPVRAAIVDGETFARQWPAGGPWGPGDS